MYDILYFHNLNTMFSISAFPSWSRGLMPTGIWFNGVSSDCTANNSGTADFSGTAVFGRAVIDSRMSASGSE